MKVTLAQAHAIKDFIDEELDNYVERKVKKNSAVLLLTKPRHISIMRL